VLQTKERAPTLLSAIFFFGLTIESIKELGGASISYIQQTNHKWIEGDEEEIGYAQATKSLKVVPIDIQHGPEVLQRFKVTHEPLVKTRHGKPWQID